jgi:hypothetical protein
MKTLQECRGLVRAEFPKANYVSVGAVAKYFRHKCVLPQDELETEWRVYFTLSDGAHSGDGPMDVYEWENPDGLWTAFQAAIALWSHFNNYDPRQKQEPPQK